MGLLSFVIIKSSNWKPPLCKREIFLKTNIVYCIVGTLPCSMVGAFTLVKKSKQIQIIAVFVSTLFNTIGKLNRFSLINTFCGQLRHSTYIWMYSKLYMKYLINVKKSDNLQYNTLVCWIDGTNDLSTKHLAFQVFIFINSNRLRALKTLYLYVCNFIKKIKNE